MVGASCLQFGKPKLHRKPGGGEEDPQGTSEPSPTEGDEGGPQGPTGEPEDRPGENGGRKARVRSGSWRRRDGTQSPPPEDDGAVGSRAWWSGDGTGRPQGCHGPVLAAGSSDTAQREGSRADRVRGPEELGRFRPSGYSGLRRVPRRDGPPRNFGGERALEAEPVGASRRCLPATPLPADRGRPPSASRGPLPPPHRIAPSNRPGHVFDLWCVNRV